jgi:hypothetical protein
MRLGYLIANTPMPLRECEGRGPHGIVHCFAYEACSFVLLLLLYARYEWPSTLSKAQENSQIYVLTGVLAAYPPLWMGRALSAIIVPNCAF